MGFFSGKSFVPIEGRKDLSNTKPIKEFLNPNTVAIPLRTMDSEAFEALVSVGDKVKIGTKIGQRIDHFSVPLFSSISGTVIAIEKRDHASLKKADHIVIENDFKEEVEPLFEGGNLDSLSPEDVKARIKDLGVIGLGGAGFPTYIKFGNTADVKTLLINGVECEPYITADEFNMKESADLLMQGLQILIKAADAQKAIIVIKEGKKELYDLLKSELKEKIELTTVPDVYPAGWEKFIVNHVMKKDYEKIPVEIGCVVMNTSTVIEFARSLNSGLPIHTRLITISGEGIKEPCTVRVKVGTKLSEAIEAIGGYTEEVIKNPKASKLVAGGPLMGAPLTTDEVSINTASNGFLALPPVSRQESPCSRCGACVVNCPKGLQPIQILKAHQNKDMALLEKLGADQCISCGICSFVCPSFIELTEVTTKAKKAVIAQAKK